MTETIINNHIESMELLSVIIADNKYRKAGVHATVDGDQTVCGRKIGYLGEVVHGRACDCNKCIARIRESGRKLGEVK